MFDKHFVGLNLTGIEDNGTQRPVSRVTLRVDDSKVLTAGDDTGVELAADCPHATQAMVNSILASVRGLQYRMYNADNAALDPAAELGDGGTFGNVYSVISRIADDGSGYAGAAAPGEAELEDEYPSAGPMTQEFNRQIAQTRSSITKTAEMIRLEVSNEVAGLNARITIEVDRITSEVNDTAAGLSSKIEQTASSLLAQITATDGRVSSIAQSLDSIALRVQNAEGDIGQLELTATSFNTRITNAEGGVASLQQTATSLQSQINATDGRVSSIAQKVDNIRLSVTNGSTSSYFELRAGSAVLSSGTITFNGVVTFSDLRGNQTIINGSTIDTSTLFLDTLYGDTIYLRDRYGDIGAQFNIGGAASARNACELWARALRMTSYPGDIFLDARSGYVTLAGGAGVTCGNNFYPQATGRYSCGTSGFRWSDIYATNGTIQTSDREKKKDIHYGLEVYDALFDRLRPVSYKLVDGQSGRTHLGLISQDVEQALEECGISSQDFAGFVKTPREGEEGAYDYSLRYGEFIALCIHQIQLLQARVARLERSMA